MATKEQLSLLGDFETTRAANALFCHQDFLEKLAAHARDSVGKRAAFHVVTFPNVIRQTLGADTPWVTEREATRRFLQELAAFSRKPWSLG